LRKSLWVCNQSKHVTPTAAPVLLVMIDSDIGLAACKFHTDNNGNGPTRQIAGLCQAQHWLKQESKVAEKYPCGEQCVQ
jgi:hypothetical protein